MVVCDVLDPVIDSGHPAPGERWFDGHPPVAMFPVFEVELRPGIDDADFLKCNKAHERTDLGVWFANGKEPRTIGESLDTPQGPQKRSAKKRAG